jgi:hypothetical protein
LNRLQLGRKLTSLAQRHQRHQQTAREDKLNFSIGGILVEQRELEMKPRGDSQAYLRKTSSLHDIDWRLDTERRPNTLRPLEQ